MVSEGFIMNKTVSVIDEQSYAEIMKNTVEPFLEKLRKDDTFISFDGKRIHYEAYLTENPKANIVISHGFTESAEKFREMAYYFIKDGFSVFSIDHRGHGSSYRLPGDSYAVRLNSFDDYIKDFDAFINDIVIPRSRNLPLYLYSHSLGAAIGIIYMEKHSGVFKKALLSSPMICINAGMPLPAAKVLSGIITAVGKGDVPVPGKCKFNENETFEKSDAASEARFDYYMKKKRKNPLLRTTGPTFNWVKEASSITGVIMNDDNCKKIKEKILIIQPEQDKQLISSYCDKFNEKLNSSELIKIGNTKHEIFSSKNDAMEEYLKSIFEFFNKDE